MAATLWVSRPVQLWTAGACGLGFIIGASDLSLRLGSTREEEMIFKTMKAALVASALMVTGVHAQTVDVTWWDFLGGGDGVRMKTLLADFNAEYAGKIQINATTLDWGIPFYT